MTAVREIAAINLKIRQTAFSHGIINALRDREIRSVRKVFFGEGVSKILMADLNPQHMIEEIQDNIKTGDLLKGQLVLAHIRDVDLKTRNRLIYYLTRADAEFSVPLFIYLLKHQAEVAEEMPIIRETMLSILLAYPEKLIAFLGSPNIEGKSELIRPESTTLHEDSFQCL